MTTDDMTPDDWRQAITQTGPVADLTLIGLAVEVAAELTVTDVCLATGLNTKEASDLLERWAALIPEGLR